MLKAPATREWVPEPPREPPSNVRITNASGPILIVPGQLQFAAGSNSTQILNVGSTDEKKVLGVLLVMGVARLMMGRIHFDPSTLRPPIASWWDVSSVYDPVCVGGHVMEKDVHGVDVVNVTKLRGLPREHVAYFGNPAVAGVIAAALASAQGECHVEPTAVPLAGGARWHQRLAQHWWWGLPITLGAAFLVLRLSPPCKLQRLEDDGYLVSPTSGNGGTTQQR